MPAIDHRPIFHLTAPSGWINDPNGVCHHGGRYHVYYQHNPGANRWGDIHWGHASSADLVHWRDEPLALAPSPGDDQGGCFSGSFARVDGMPTMFYTGYTPQRQVQCVATSQDMIRWTKHPQRTLAEPPPGVEAHDFRDPYVFAHEGWWYMVLGAGQEHRRAQCLIYRSPDGVHWEDRGVLFAAPHARHGVMWECPNLFPLGDRWVLTVSLWQGPGALAWVGRFEGERFLPDHEMVLDGDSGAFAHLAMRAPDGRTLQWAWMNEQRDQGLIDLDGWAGALSVPRELSLDARGRLLQAPAAEVALLRGDAADVAATGLDQGVLHRFQGRHLDIEAVFEAPERGRQGLNLCAAPDGSEFTRVVYQPEMRRLSIERARSSLTREVSHQNLHAHLALDPAEALELRVLLDGSVLEVFANRRVCLSTRVYPQSAASRLGEVFSEGPARAQCAVWRMRPMWAGKRAAALSGPADL
ncbi:glycoside hydrolase family 32 protein [Amphibiibacter pelophylacis]|uniref:Glycoside hydrolase family 32 protein n=1 Tax=Amphibiibacter pelophylacis TaxID=1799477 RepID=A0ACC6P1Z9_9BURK